MWIINFETGFFTSVTLPRVASTTLKALDFGFSIQISNAFVISTQLLFIHLCEFLKNYRSIVLTAQDIIKSLTETDAFISSQEETILGDWLEGLAIFINGKVYGGRKSGILNVIDLEFDKDSVRYIVNIKSGPNWGNSSQIAKMIADFRTVKKTLRTSNSQLNIVAVNGCCYGRDNQPDKGDYFKYCGQKFWEFISGDPELYIKIIEPLGHQAQERNDDFIQSYAKMINKFTTNFRFRK